MGKKQMTQAKRETQEIVGSTFAQSATGCYGAGDYGEWARLQGYPYLRVVDWTSSAGDWSFIVSRTGRVWFPMFQENNYPGHGFTRTIDKTRRYYGSADKVLQIISEEMDAAFLEMQAEIDAAQGY